MRLKALSTVALVSALAVSVAAAAPPPGIGQEKAAAGQAKAAEARAKAQGAAAAAKAARAAQCRPHVMLVLKGTYVSGTADATGVGSFAMEVTRANRHGRLLAGKQATVLTDAATKVRRQGKATLSALQAGDRLNVHVRACKRADVATLQLLAKHVIAAPARTTTTETTTTGTTTTSP
jgi:hypothetical protein